MCFLSLFVPFFYDSACLIFCRLCVIGLAQGHVALTEKGGVTAVDFNVGKSDRSELKVTGKRKRVSECAKKIKEIQTLQER
jgi:hypothetical protein